MIGTRDDVVKELDKVERDLRRLRNMSHDPLNRMMIARLVLIAKLLKRIIVQSKGAKS